MGAAKYASATEKKRNTCEYEARPWKPLSFNCKWRFRSGGQTFIVEVQ